MKNPGEAPVCSWTGVPGWESPAEQAVLKRFASLVPAKGSMLEIGSEFGMSASILRKFSTDSAHLLCVEPNTEAPFMGNLQEANLAKNVHWWPVKSDSFFEVWPQWEFKKWGLSSNKFDLIFVDGDHHYPQVKRDILNAFGWVCPEGYVILHDVAVSTNEYPHEQHQEVLKSMLEAMEERPAIVLVETVDTMAILKLKQE